LVEKLEDRLTLAADFLYVGDAGSAGDTVQRFNATTGEHLGTFVAAGSLLGPRGTVFDSSGNLLVVNQNVGQPFAGELLRFDGTTGAALPPLVPASNPQAPFAPRGIVIRDNILYVADINEGSPSGRIAKFNATTGSFLGDLVPTGFSGEFRPRGLVFGPDDALYVSVFSPTLFDTNDPAGYVLRFQGTSSGAFQVIAGNNGDGAFQSGEIADLHNPEGLVFGPDGRLYVTSDRANVSDTDKILVLDTQTRTLKDKIVLDQIGQDRAYAQSILFGPDGKLFATIRGDSPGSVRRYDVATKTFSVFVASGFFGPLSSPWYLTFGHTDPATLAYRAASANYPPVLAGVEGTALVYAANNLPLAVTATITATDATDAMLNHATIRITANYQNGQDILGFTNTATITGAWNGTTGTLTLSGNDTLAHYQAALRAVTYRNTSANSSSGTRTVSFQVNDGAADSNLVTRDIAITSTTAVSDYLFVGDQGDPNNPNDDTVRRFDATTGEYLGAFNTPGTLVGPRGIVFANPEALLAVNQNVDLPKAGSVLRFDAKTGTLLNSAVPENDANAPFAPRGIVVHDHTMYVADFAQGSPSGRIAKYDVASGNFLGNLVPNGFGPAFRPRGLVFGPDDQLYVSVFDLSTSGDSNPQAGYVLRLNPVSGAYSVVAANDGDGIREPGEVADLHMPEGLVFGPDGRLYVTSFRPDANDTNKILVLNPTTGALLDKVELDQAGQPSAFAQALVFGPAGRLLVPISGDGPDTGSVRRYDVTTKTFDVFVKPAAEGGPLGMPWYLALGHMRQDTLAHDADWNVWHNSANPRDVDGRNGVEPLDALLIINYINAPDSRWPDPPASPTVPPRYYDVTGGSTRAAIEPKDALRVVNYLNAQPSGAGEGEGAPVSALVSLPQLAETASFSAPASSASGAHHTMDGLPAMSEPTRQLNDPPASNPASTSSAANRLSLQSTLLMPRSEVWEDDSTVRFDAPWLDEAVLLFELAVDIAPVWQSG